MVILGLPELSPLKGCVPISCSKSNGFPWNRWTPCYILIGYSCVWRQLYTLTFAGNDLRRGLVGEHTSGEGVVSKRF